MRLSTFRICLAALLLLAFDGGVFAAPSQTITGISPSYGPTLGGTAATNAGGRSRRSDSTPRDLQPIFTFVGAQSCD
jgi:hypothetical protein